jgi:heterodisulfide reductase subunit A
MARLSGTYLNFAAAPGLLQKKIDRLTHHPDIQVLTNAEVGEVSGYVGNFKVVVEGRVSREHENDDETVRKPQMIPSRLVVNDRAKLPSRMNPAPDKPGYSPIHGASYSSPVVYHRAKEGETEFPNGFDDTHHASRITFHVSRFTFDLGAIVVATGWQPYDLSLLLEYGGGTIPDVIDALAFEKMLAPGAEVRRPSDGKAPREVVFVQCAGSRDRACGVPYCSKVCCMAVAKSAMLYKERVPGGQAYVFYTDIRSAGKGYDEYVQRAMADYGTVYLRGKVSKVFQQGDKVTVWGEDTLSGQAVEIAADLVVLATPMLPNRGAVELSQRLHISADANGFFNEAHPKLRPVETLTAGIFLAGASQGPKDIPETVAQAGAAAAKVLQLFSHDQMSASPAVATVIEELCAACGACVRACPYSARQIHPVWNIATVNAALCQSCGACVTACPNKASQVRNWRPEQVMGMVDELL